MPPPKNCRTIAAMRCMACSRCIGRTLSTAPPRGRVRERARERARGRVRAPERARAWPPAAARRPGRCAAPSVRRSSTHIGSLSASTLPSSRRTPGAPLSTSAASIRLPSPSPASGQRPPARVGDVGLVGVGAPDVARLGDLTFAVALAEGLGQQREMRRVVDLRQVVERRLRQLLTAEWTTIATDRRQLAHEALVQCAVLRQDRPHQHAAAVHQRHAVDQRGRVAVDPEGRRKFEHGGSPRERPQAALRQATTDGGRCASTKP